MVCISSVNLLIYFPAGAPTEIEELIKGQIVVTKGSVRRGMDNNTWGTFSWNIIFCHYNPRVSFCISWTLSAENVMDEFLSQVQVVTQIKDTEN